MLEEVIFHSTPAHGSLPLPLPINTSSSQIHLVGLLWYFKLSLKMLWFYFSDGADSKVRYTSADDGLRMRGKEDGADAHA